MTTSFLYTDEDLTLSWERTEQIDFFTFFTFQKFALQHFFRKIPWFVVEHKAVKLKVEIIVINLRKCVTQG